MSKIGKKPVEIKEGVNVVYENRTIKISGSKGELEFHVPDGIDLKIENGRIDVSEKIHGDRKINALFGLTRAIIANMVTGVTKGFERKLELSGVGYRAQASGNSLSLSLGFSHPVNIKVDQGVTFSVAENIITVAGMDKDLVGNTAAKIRAIRPPEPYKGKGIKYQGERIRRKAGKAAKAIGGKP
jgi:large subunit ribosomal protein L6